MVAHIQHSTECQQRQLEYEQSRQQWIATWPKYCRNCNGWGGATFYQSHPYGSTSVSEPMFEPCECTAERCPRCGGYGLTREGHVDVDLGAGPCTFCGWNYDDGLPEPPECDCWATMTPE